LIRKPRLAEVPGIKKLLDAAAQNDDVLPRPLMELYETARDFHVYVEDGLIAGCCALHIDMADLAEIRSLVVRDESRGRGVGAGLLDACIAEARQLEIARVYALTRKGEFFIKHGFREIDKRGLPHKVFNDCVRCPMWPDCDEIAVVRDLTVVGEDRVNANEGE